MVSVEEYISGGSSRQTNGKESANSKFSQNLDTTGCTLACRGNDGKSKRTQRPGTNYYFLLLFRIAGLVVLTEQQEFKSSQNKQ